jgi:Tol biopolymer transport system component
MNETRIEKVALAVVACCSLILSGAVIVTILYLSMVLVSLIAAQPMFAQSTAGVRLEAGIEKEEVDGDFKSAMEIYQKIAADSTVPRDVRSKALLRLGGCYEKLGQQAGQVYEQIVRDFADQPAAAQARSRLAALKQQENPAAPTTMTLRKIEWSAVGIIGPSDTDGNRAVYQDSGDNLFFGDLSGHTKRMIFKAEPGHAPGWVPSRDFSMVSLAFHAKPRRLAVVKTDGTGYRELVRDDSQAAILAAGWSTGWSWDDRYLVVYTNREKGGGHLFVVSVADGQRRELLSIAAGYFTKAVFSHDGRFVAYEVAPLPGEGLASRVFIVAAQGGEPRQVYESVPKRVVHRPGLDYWTLLDWTADGSHLEIADAPRGRAALYLLPIKNGAAAGAPAFVRYGAIESGYTTASGALVYEASPEPGGADVFLASLDTDGHLGSWRRLEIHGGGRRGFNPWPSFSPDASQIAYMSRDNPAGDPNLVLHDLSTGQERVLYQPGSGVGLQCRYATHLPKIFCIELEAGGKANLISVSADSGEVKRFGTFGEPVAGQVWLDQASQDDQAVYVSKESTTDWRSSEVRWDMATRQETVLAVPSEAYERDEPSSDEHWLLRAIPSQKAIAVRPMSGGEWRSLTSVRGFAWPYVTTPDGNWVIYGDDDSSGKRAFFWVRVSGGEPERLADSPTQGSNGLWVSPDGRQILTVSTNWAKYDLWVLDNFVPPVKH